jgi:N-hydroxyarylamine O-acetyltransferase
MATQVDLGAYFRRIRWTGATAPVFATLKGLLHAHTSHIPFENLDVLLHRPVRLDLDSIQAKLVGANRGGYCFEHASLFAAVLEALGFEPKRHAGRVVLFTPPAEAPRTHMFLTVPVGGATYIIDPGFGAFASQAPVPLADGPARQTHCRQTHWMTREGGLWALHVPRDGVSATGWVTTLETEYPIDFEVANHFTATHPDSPFTNTIMLSGPTPHGRVNVMNRDVTIRRGTETTKMRLRDRSALRALLADHFGFDLPEVEQMKVPAIPDWQ